MTELEWTKAICRVDAAALAQWKRDHPNNVDTLPVSTKRDNYGLVGSKGKKSKDHNRAKWDSFQASVKPAAAAVAKIMEGI